MKRELTPRQLNEYGAKLSTGAKVVLLFLSALVIGAFASNAAHAQTVPVLTFTPSVTSGNGSLATSLTWSTTPAAQSCTASGHTTWTGAKATSGTATLPPITLSGSYTLTMLCNWAGDNQAVVSWTPPTRNTDGTTLTACAAGATSGSCLAGYRIYRRVGTTDMNGAEMTPVTGAAVTSRTFPNLVAGTHNFAMEAVNGDGNPSPITPIVSKTITATSSVTRSVTLTVNPLPGQPTGVAVE